jgi:hypothetical protein
MAIVELQIVVREWLFTRSMTTTFGEPRDVSPRILRPSVATDAQKKFISAHRLIVPRLPAESADDSKLTRLSVQR